MLPFFLLHLLPTLSGIKHCLCLRCSQVEPIKPMALGRGLDANRPTALDHSNPPSGRADFTLTSPQLSPQTQPADRRAGRERERKNKKYTLGNSGVLARSRALENATTQTADSLARTGQSTMSGTVPTGMNDEHSQIHGQLAASRPPTRPG